MSANVSHVRVS